MKKGGLFVIYIVLVIGMMNYFRPLSTAPFAQFNHQSITTDTETIQVSVVRKENVIKVALEDYLVGVVGSEMPAHFELEALKAQSVAARTFVVNRNYQVDDTVASQAYHSAEELQTLWGSSYEQRILRIKEAIAATEGEIMTFNGKVISALYFSTSNGKTANSEEYYTSALPYLRSVESPWDLELNPKATSTVFFTFTQLQNMLGIKEAIQSISVVSRFEDQRVSQVKINGKKYTGREVRELLNLRSSDFSVKKTKKGFEFVTTGYGHGVGMSQYGAQGMALEGKSYKEILRHFYQNVEIIDLMKYKQNN